MNQSVNCHKVDIKMLKNEVDKLKLSGTGGGSSTPI
jgi:hypothetical protein